MIFYLLRQDSTLLHSLKGKYLAYIVLLAGWIWFCIRLYTQSIFPPQHPSTEPSNLMMDNNQVIPLAFRWGSDVPISGQGFEGWKAQFAMADSANSIVVIRSYYFRDEASDEQTLRELGQRRMKSVLAIFKPDESRLLVEYLPQEVNADVRAKPFQAIGFDLYSERDILSFKGDTVQICFPIADSLMLPGVLAKQFDEWGQRHRVEAGSNVFLNGTADGTGIAESSDLAMDRAAWIRDRWMKQGWPVDVFRITTSQRIEVQPILNRCVLVYFEPDTN